MIAAFVVLHGSFAVVAALPALFFRNLLEGKRGGVLGTFAVRMEFAATGRADEGPAFRAQAVFPLQAGGVIPGFGEDVDVLRSDKLATALSGAVDAVLGGSLFVLGIPLFFE